MSPNQMAGISRIAKNRWKITFRLDNQSKSFRYRGSAKNANAIKVHIESIIEARNSGLPLVASTAAWLRDLNDEMYDKLCGAKLVHPRRREAPMTLGDLTRVFVERSTVKHGTLQVYRQAIRSLHEYFPENIPLASITPIDADGWRAALAESSLMPATQSKRINTAKAIFNRAVKWELLDRSPFRDLKSGSQTNPARQHYVDAAVIHDVLQFCPDDEWRAVIGLARFAGLRCPSEISRLVWSNVDLDERRMLVISPKTEHHAGKDRRIVPIAPPLLPILQQLHAGRLSATGHVVPRLAGRSNANLRTQFLKFIKRSGHEEWPRLFQNLRASAEMDWMEVSPPHAVANWMGHSLQVALRHYMMVRDSDIFEATSPEAWEQAKRRNRRGRGQNPPDGGD